MSQIFSDGLRGANLRSVAALNREKNVCTSCRQAKVKCERDLIGLACRRCLKKRRPCIPATNNRRVSNLDHNIPRGHNEPHLHNYQVSQSSSPAHAHNLTDLMQQATDHWQQLYLSGPSIVYYFQGYSMPVDIYDHRQEQENAFVNSGTNNLHNTFSSFNYPTWNTGLGTTRNFNELPLGYYNGFDETRL